MTFVARRQHEQKLRSAHDELNRVIDGRIAREQEAQVSKTFWKYSSFFNALRNQIPLFREPYFKPLAFSIDSELILTCCT